MSQWQKDVIPSDPLIPRFFVLFCFVLFSEGDFQTQKYVEECQKK